MHCIRLTMVSTHKFVIILSADHYVVWYVSGRMWGINLNNQVADIDIIMFS